MMIDGHSYCGLAICASILMVACGRTALAQGSQQNVLGSSAGQQGEVSGERNAYGWPTDYVAQVGAGVTNGATTGYSGVKESPTDNPKPALPELPSARLCAEWQDSKVHRFCMEKLVR
jgi:hypothetical protein